MSTKQERLATHARNLLDEARAAQAALGEPGVNTDEVAERLGQSRSHVYNLLRLLKLDQGIVDAMVKGDLSVSNALRVDAISDVQTRAQALRFAIEKQAGARRLARFINNLANERTPQHKFVSEQGRAYIDARTIAKPLLVTGISQPGEMRTIQPSDFHLLDVDTSYQRSKTEQAAKLIQILHAGGLILDPVTLCSRSWAEPTIARKLWIVDGQQRVLAFRALNRAFSAIVHTSDSLDSEKRFFAALNSRKNITADVIVKAWQGPSGALIAHTQRVGHALSGRVSFDKRSGTAQISAAALVRGSLAAAEGLLPHGSIQGVLRRLDGALGDATKRARAEHFLHLVGNVYPQGRPPGWLVLAGLARVAYERWLGDELGVMPSKAQLARLGHIDWDKEVPSLTAKYLPVVQNTVGRVWR